MTERKIKIYDKVFAEFCEVGQRAVLIVQKNGVTQRIQTSIVEHCVINPSGKSSVITKNTIYRTETCNA